jgi:Flp pilus assembly protein TadG
MRFLQALLRRRLRQLKRDQRGVSAIEFAMLAPLLIALYFGVVEISQGVAIDRKSMLAARTVADLVSQQLNTITKAEIDNLMKAAQTVTEPYPTGPLKTVVSQVKIDVATGQATIDWSYAGPGATKRTKGSTVTTEIPPQLIPPVDAKAQPIYLIWGETQYLYVPVFAKPIIGTIPFKEQSFMSPRQSTSITNSGF